LKEFGKLIGAIEDEKDKLLDRSYEQVRSGEVVTKPTKYLLDIVKFKIRENILENSS
jgi:hypothetical protein